MLSSRLSLVLLRWQEAVDQGIDLSAEELCPGEPLLAERLRPVLENLRLVNRLVAEVVETDSTGPEAPPTVSPPADSGAGEWPATRGLRDGDSRSTSLPTQGQAPRPETVPGYEVLAELGRGGMGVVYKARQVGLGRLVALKMILAGTHAGAEELSRFKTEGEAIARLRHPNIVQVYEVGEHEGKPFFSLEFCEGGGLDKKLAGNPLPPEQAARLVEVLARAMQAAHEAHVIHRDLKPANVLLSVGQASPPDSSHSVRLESVTCIPRITDFGLAKKLDEAGQTQSGAVMGTPSYMAPEQAGGKSKEIGPLADVYALGAILYECLTGRPPFRAATSFDTLMQVVHDEPVPPRQLNAKVPVDLETVCLKCLHKEPAKRYLAAGALAEDLGRWQRGEPVAARPVGGVERALRWRRRNPLVAGLLFLVAVLAITGCSGIVWKWQEAIHQRQTAEIARLEAEKSEERANAEARQAQQVADLLVGVFATTAGDQSRGHSVTAAELLDSGAKRIRQELEDQPRLQVALLDRIGHIYLNLGMYPSAEKQFSANSKLCREHFGEGSAEYAASLTGMGLTLLEEGEYGRARPYFQQACDLRERVLGEQHPLCSESRRHLARMALLEGDLVSALKRYQGLLEWCERVGADSRTRAELMQQLAETHRLRGEYSEAIRIAEESSVLLKAAVGEKHTAFLAATENLAVLSKEMGKHGRALALLEQALSLRQELLGEKHPAYAQCLNNLAALHQFRGDYGKAEPLYRKALGVYEDLFAKERYPLGHPLLAQTISNLALLYQAQGEHAKAHPLFVRALRMREGLYPKGRYPQGHPDLAVSINDLAVLHRNQAEYDKAEPLFARALRMRESLYTNERYPQGHPDLAQSLNNLAELHRAQGEYGKAEPLYARALRMYERLYPKERYSKGHPDLARSLNDLAALHHMQGDHAKAEPLLRRALAIYESSAAALAASAPEATALNYLASLPSTRDNYLSVTRYQAKAASYEAVWQNKAALSRVYERRHLAMLTATSPRARALWQTLRILRRERETLLLAPANPSKAKARDRRLDAIDDELRAKEAELLPLLAAPKRSEELARATPTDLRKALPTRMAFVDLLRYTHFEQDPKVPGTKGEKRTPHYVAFVVMREEVKRIELGNAQPIEEMLDLWRRALVEGAEAEPGYAAKVHALLWRPLQKHLPAKTTMVYISPDAALNRVPWSALREAGTGPRLIEEHNVAVIPHGVLLLDRLTEPKRDREKRPTLVVMGDVAYDRKPKPPTNLLLRGPVAEKLKWESLPGTRKELEQIVALAGDRRIIRREGAEANVATLLGDLPQAETAHLATHGFFADARFRTALQLDPELFDRTTRERIGAGSRNPLVLSGLVCSSANLPQTPNRGVLTAEAIVALDLRKMNLAVLSACETGLGETVGGEGVYGLVRAFHIAGARNVIASTWKVDDKATAALMVLFYRHLWGNKPLPPAEALRQAQLALYRNPQHVKEWAQGRGPNLKVVMAGGPALLAAFVLSGPGN
jgi:CHAT domain-containing protein